MVGEDEIAIAVSKRVGGGWVVVKNIIINDEFDVKVYTAEEGRKTEKD